MRGTLRYTRTPSFTSSTAIALVSITTPPDGGVQRCTGWPAAGTSAMFSDDAVRFEDAGSAACDRKMVRRGVHIDDPTPLVDAEVGHAATDTRAHDVDEYVEPVVRGDGCRDGRVDGLRVRDITDEIRTAYVDADDGRALLGQAGDDPRPMPPAAPDTGAIFARSRSMGEE